MQVLGGELVGHRLGVQNLWSCDDWKRYQYSPEDWCFSSIPPENINPLCHHCHTHL